MFIMRLCILLHLYNSFLCHGLSIHDDMDRLPVFLLKIQEGSISKSIEAQSTFQGSVSDHLKPKPEHSVELCIYLAISESFSGAYLGRGHLGFPTKIYRCTPLANNFEVLDETLTMVVGGFNPGTIRIKSIVVDLNYSQVYLERSIIFDVVVPPNESPDLFTAPAFHQVEELRRTITEESALFRRSETEAMSTLGLFMKDLDIHGCNLRMLRSVAHPRDFFDERRVATPLYIITPITFRNSKYI